jgi:hypothetical protein
LIFYVDIVFFCPSKHSAGLLFSVLLMAMNHEHSLACRVYSRDFLVIFFSLPEFVMDYDYANESVASECDMAITHLNDVKLSEAGGVLVVIASVAGCVLYRRDGCQLNVSEVAVGNRGHQTLLSSDTKREHVCARQPTDAPFPYEAELNVSSWTNHWILNI